MEKLFYIFGLARLHGLSIIFSYDHKSDSYIVTLSEKDPGEPRLTIPADCMLVLSEDQLIDGIKQFIQRRKEL